MTRLKQTVDRGLEAVLVVLMSANVFNVLWQVFTRFILKNPSSFTEELARFLLIWVGLLGAAYASGQKMHLSIDILVRGVRGKTRRTAELVIQALIFGFALSVLLIGGTRLVVITLKLNQVSASLRIQLGYVYAVLPLSGMLIMFYALVFFLERWRKGSSEDLEAGRTPGCPSHPEPGV